MVLQNSNIFKGLNKEDIKLLEEKSKYLIYKIGQPLSSNKNIQSNVLIILSGTARLLGNENDKSITIAKLGAGSSVGLASLLRAEACEDVHASTEVKVISIPDQLIIDLYTKNLQFQKNCNDYLYPSEVKAIVEKLISRSPRTDINVKTAFNVLFKNSNIQTFKQDEIIPLKEDFINIVASANYENKEIGDLLNCEIKPKARPPFFLRVIQIPKKIYEMFMDKALTNNLNIDNETNENDDAKFAPLLLERSTANVGRYSPQKNKSIIRGNGEIREALACLQMLANDLNLPFRNDSVEKILRDEIRRGKKINLDLCGNLLSLLGLHVSKSKIKKSYALRMPESSLLLWKNSFALVHNSKNNHLTLASPKEGWIEINEENFEENFEDDIEFIAVERINTTPNKKFGLEWFIPSLKKFQGVLIQVLIASFIVQLFGLANPLLIQVIIDKVISQRSLDTLQVLGIAMVFVTILGGVIGSLRTFLFTETTNRIDTRLGSEVIDHLLRLPLNYFDKRPVGELGSRVAELEKIRDFLTGQALTTILDAAFSIIYIVVMVIYSWLLTLIALAVVPIQILLTLIGAPLLRRQIRETAVENAKTQSHLVEVLTGIQTVKAQNIETVSRWRWQELYGRYISRTFEKTITGTALGQTSQVLQQLSQLLVLWVGASLVLSGNLTLGQLIAFRIISGFVTQPLLRLSSIWQSIQELRVSFERLADIIDTPEESSESDKSNITLPEIKGKVLFKEVYFAFKKNQPEVLKNIDLEISAGIFVGIAGQSGSGKSTLMKLLPRLYNLNRGKILIDNFDISKVELYSLRRQIGIVPQDPLLFAGTVSENIAITNPDVSGDEIIEAAKIADAHNFIMDLPLGYSTNVGERGTSLSGGQKQRLAIARTLISRPKMLIMDEATSALDYETERRVCENLKEKCKGLTVFFITHRLSTIKNADKIVMMHDGAVCEIGTHTELINKKSRYYALYRQQESS